MFYSKDNINSKWGQITTKVSKRGIEIHSYNHERGRLLHVGTVKGQTYEKVCNILRKPEPSFTMAQDELNAARDSGALYFRPISEGRTFSISLDDFSKHAERFYNAYYGEQLRCSIRFFACSATKAKRNSVTDSPVLPSGGLIEHVEQMQQMSFFGGG